MKNTPEWSKNDWKCKQTYTWLNMKMKGALETCHGWITGGGFGGLIVLVAPAGRLCRNGVATAAPAPVWMICRRLTSIDWQTCSNLISAKIGNRGNSNICRRPRTMKGEKAVAKPKAAERVSSRIIIVGEQIFRPPKYTSHDPMSQILKLFWRP